MPNYMTLGEFNEKLGRLLRENPDKKNLLVVDSEVVQTHSDPDGFAQGTVLLTIGKYADDVRYDKDCIFYVVPESVDSILM